MKFGKQILKESSLNEGLHYTNYKQLKKLLKALVNAFETGDWTLAQAFNLKFGIFLQNEMVYVESTYLTELQKIDAVQKKIMQLFPLLAIQADPEVFCSLKFEQLLDHLQAECFSDELFAVCSNLGEMSSRCKALRRNVIWNSIAVVKIIKKKKKMLKTYDISTDNASSILSSQNWYSSPRLPELISAVDTMIEEVMSRLTSKPPSRECYTCPICLDLIVDPVTLRGCLHRFCWNCLARVTVGTQETGQEMERCPYCRSSCTLDPETFVVDGILNRFLRRFFPEDIELRMADQEAERISLVTAYNNRNVGNKTRNLIHCSEDVSYEKVVALKTPLDREEECFTEDADDTLLKEAICCSINSVETSYVTHNKANMENVPAKAPIGENILEKDFLLAYCYQNLQDYPSEATTTATNESDSYFSASLFSPQSKASLAPSDLPSVGMKNYSLWQPSHEIMTSNFWQTAATNSPALDHRTNDFFSSSYPFGNYSKVQFTKQEKSIETLYTNSFIKRETERPVSCLPSKCSLKDSFSAKEVSPLCIPFTKSGSISSVGSDTTDVPSGSEKSLSPLLTFAGAPPTLPPNSKKGSVSKEQVYKPLPQSKQPGLLPSPAEIPKAIVLYTSMAIQNGPLRRHKRNKKI